MRVNPSIDRELLEQAMQVGGEPSESAALTKALQEYIARRSRQRILKLCGRLDRDATYACKSERSRN